ncbi:MAG: cupin domain-containing protein [Planctomycetota bacterium]
MNTEAQEQDITIPASEALEVEELVEYSPDSIVSRTLAEKENGSITAFAFDQGQSLSEHTTPYDAFVQVLDGTALLTIGGKEVEVSEGELALMPADVPHAVRAPERFKMLLTMVR